MRSLWWTALLMAGMGSALAAEPNTQVPAGSRHYAASGFPDRIVASPAQDAAHGFAVMWRTDAGVNRPALELVVAGDSPDMGAPRVLSRARPRCPARTARPITTASMSTACSRTRCMPIACRAGTHGGRGSSSAPRRGRHAAHLLYFGDTQNKNLSLVSRVVRQAWRSTPDARLALFAGDLVSGKDGVDDSEWGEWFEAGRWLLQGTAVAPAPGNHEYHEEHEDTPQARRVLGGHWPVTFALPKNGPAAAAQTATGSTVRACASR
jgi:hypothetical protein